MVQGSETSKHLNSNLSYLTPGPEGEWKCLCKIASELPYLSEHLSDFWKEKIWETALKVSKSWMNDAVPWWACLLSIWRKQVSHLFLIKFLLSMSYNTKTKWNKEIEKIVQMHSFLWFLKLLSALILITTLKRASIWATVAYTHFFFFLLWLSNEPNTLTRNNLTLCGIHFLLKMM